MVSLQCSTKFPVLALVLPVLYFLSAKASDLLFLALPMYFVQLHFYFIFVFLFSQDSDISP